MASTVFTVAESDAEPIRCANGLRVLADRTLGRDSAPIDVLVYPGGIGTRPQLGQEHVRERMRGARGGGRADDERLHRLARLRRRRAARRPAGDDPLTPRSSCSPRWATDIDVRADERFVDDGDVITAAGVSAGIDMALHLVARLHSPERAAQVRREIQYDPEPPS